MLVVVERVGHVEALLSASVVRGERLSEGRDKLRPSCRRGGDRRLSWRRRRARLIVVVVGGGVAGLGEYLHGATPDFHPKT